MKRGKFLIDLRNKKGLTQSDIAEKLGYTPQLVSLWEKDKVIPDLSIISKYASILKIDLEGFIKCKERKKNDNCDTKSFDFAKFSANLRYLRKKNNYFQSDVAKALNVNVKSVLYWENGTSVPSLANFITLCIFYKQSFDELYFAYKEEKTQDEEKKSKLVPILVSSFSVLAVAGLAIGLIVGLSNKGTTICEHQFSKTTIAATYESEGKEMYACDLCGYTYDEVIPKLVHNYANEYEHDETYHYHRCIDEGYEDLVDEYVEHHYSRHVVEATFEKDGSIKYTCVECFYSYTEIIPHLVHNYSTTWSYDKTHHFHSCTDEGYEDLYVDKEEHTFSHVTDESGAITYTCDTCGYSFVTANFITVLDIYDENGERYYSVSKENGMYCKVLNANKYNVTNIGFKIVIQNEGKATFDGTISSNYFQCLDSENYTLYYIDSSLFRQFPSLTIVGCTYTLQLLETIFDPNLHGVTCDEFLITVTE